MKTEAKERRIPDDRTTSRTRRSGKSTKTVARLPQNEDDEDYKILLPNENIISFAEHSTFNI